MTISGFVAYVKQAWKNKPDTSTPLSAARLTHVEEGVKANSDAIAKIAAAVINQQANDANKIPSSALMYSVNEKVDSAISDLVAINRNFSHFATYETSTGGTINTAESFLAGLKEIYTGIPDNCVFIIFASFSGTYVCLEGLRTTASFGTVTATSYADAANKRYSILNGTWTLK